MGIVLPGCLGTIGCRLTDPGVTAAPLSVAQQRAAILKIVPVGTPRDKVVGKLHTAGIGGTFGTGDSIYYCDMWKRDDGQMWQLDVALLFDEAGKLYELRQGEFLMSEQPQESPPRTARTSTADDSRAIPFGTPPRRTAPAVFPAGSPNRTDIPRGPPEP